MHKIAYFTKIFKTAALGLTLITMFGCADDFDRKAKRYEKDPFDWNANLSRSEINEAIRPQRPELDRDKTETDKFKGKHGDGATIPSFSPVVLAPDSPDIKSAKRVSLTVTENVSLKEVFLELARLAELELALDPNIKGGIILSVNNRPVKEVIEMVCDMANLRYSADGNVLKVEVDTPYLVNYNADFLNLTRSGKGSIKTNTKTDAGKSGGGSGGGGGGSSSGGSSGSTSLSSLNSGSSNDIDTEIDGKFWESLEENLIAIIGAKLANLKTQSAEAEDNIKATATPAAAKDKGANGEDEVVVKAKDLEAKVKPIDQPSKAAGPNSYYTINKQAGIISIMATKRKHKSVEEYLNKLKESLSQQVLIEAKVVEVTLKEEFGGGIDWTKLRIGNQFDIGMKNAPVLAGIFTNGNAFDDPTATATASTNGKLTLSGTTPEAVLNMLEGFGVTRTLANPRITVANNQQAILSFAKNQTYYTTTVTPAANATTTTGSTSTSGFQFPTVTSTLNTVPIGVILSLQPSINSKTQEISLHIRPTLTEIESAGQSDPAVDIAKYSVLASAVAVDTSVQATLNEALGKISSKVPIVRSREIDTILKAKSGDVMVLGGLIQHSDQSTESGMPFLSEMPFIGRLAKQTAHKTAVTETVILIQATIIPTSYYHSQDKRVYETFTQDPRPLVFN